MATGRGLANRFTRAACDGDLDRVRESAAELAAMETSYLEDVLEFLHPFESNAAIPAAEGLAQTHNPAVLPYLDEALWRFEQYDPEDEATHRVMELLRAAIHRLEARADAPSVLDRRLACLRMAADDGDVDRAQQLAVAIASLGRGAAMRMWDTCVEPGDSTLAPSIVAAIAESGDTDFIPLLQRLAHEEEADGCPANSEAINAALARLNPKGGLERLLKQLRRQQGEDRMVLHELARLNDPAALPALKAWVQRWEKRRRGVDLLGSWVPGISTTRALIIQLEEGGPGLWREAMDESNSWALRLEALVHLVYARATELGPKVASLIDPADWVLAESAILVLIGLGYAGAQDNVVGVLSPDAEYSLRYAAFDYLYLFGDAACAQPLRPLLQDPDPGSAVSAAVVLERVTGQRHQVPYLSEESMARARRDTVRRAQYHRAGL